MLMKNINNMTGGSPRLFHCKTALKDTPEFQEVRRMIQALHEDSQQKLGQEIELQGALDQLAAQVQAIREGLAILSEAFIEETGKQNKRIIQLEKQVHIMHERHDCSHRQLETRLVEDVHALESRLNDVSQQLNERISAQGTAHRDSHQALHTEVNDAINSLSAACHSQLDENHKTFMQRTRELDERAASELVDVRRTIASSKVEMQHQHTTMLKHTQALTEEVARLAEAQEQLDCLWQSQQAQLEQLHERFEAFREQHDASLQDISMQFQHGSQSLGRAREQASSAVEKQLAALNVTVQRHVDDTSAKLASYKQDLSRVAIKLRDGLQRCKSECADLREAASQHQAAESDARAAMRADLSALVKDQVREVLNAVALLEEQHGSLLDTLQQDTSGARSSREADLEIIERALTAAHENQEQTDRVLKAALDALSDLERKLGNVTQQGDAIAGEVEELSHRLGIIQRAIMDTGKDATLSPAASLSSSMRLGRRSPKPSPTNYD